MTRLKLPGGLARDEIRVDFIAGHIAIVRTGEKMRSAVSRHLERYGIKIARYSLLQAIYFSPDRMLPQSQIARAIGVSPPSVTQLVHALEKEGLVERVIFPEDRRVTFARLRQEGIAFCDILVPSMVQFMESSMHGLTKEEVSALQQLLAKASARVEELN